MTTTSQILPRLETGDCLTREEFHHRYELRPDLKKAELIDGVVYVASPARWGKHGRQQTMMLMWLGNYAVLNPSVDVGDNDTIYLPPNEEVQPDAFLFRLTGPDAGARVLEDDYIEGSPELVVEIAASSADYDLGKKKEAYQRAGVQEYIVWQTLTGRIDWFRLREGEYIPLQANARGIVESEVFPGLRMDLAAMLAGDRAAVNAALRRQRRRR